MSQNKNIIFKFLSDRRDSWQVEVAPNTWFGTASDPALSWQDAVSACNSYTGDGNKDWFLPSIDVLTAMQSELHRNELGEFSIFENVTTCGATFVCINDCYWSSTERGIDEAAFCTFDYVEDDDNHDKKSELMFVRPVRIVQDNEEQV
jgi:hypothetical protein